MIGATRRTLTASPAMRARLGLVDPVPEPALVPPPAIAQKATVAELDPEALARRRQRLEQHNALIMALRRLAPDLFAGRERDHPPVAIGIDKEIQAALPGVAPRVVSAVLRAHTGGQGYLTHLAAGEPRRHLDGSSAGPPAAGDVTGAASRLATLRRLRAPRNTKPERDAAAVVSRPRP
jgi:sRNA-binding protein